jgi:tRNA A37 threonylcarbamoyladenosine biosynthesis protein TsaE
MKPFVRFTITHFDTYRTNSQEEGFSGKLKSSGNLQ